MRKEYGMRLLIILWILIASSLLPAPAKGQISAPDRAAENRALVQRLVLDRAAASLPARTRRMCHDAGHISGSICSVDDRFLFLPDFCSCAT